MIRVAVLLSLCFVFSTSVAWAQDEYRPKAGEFAPANVGVPLSGELVSIDHVNRRGAIRLDGDGVDDRYHRAPSHRFALLPIGVIRYHGAPAELGDIPLGTHLRGVFCLPPEGDQTIPPPLPQDEIYVPKQNHVLLLEDDFSYYTRQGQVWKVETVDSSKGKLKATLQGGTVVEGAKRDQTFDIGPSTHVWKGREIAELKDVSPGAEVQFNFTWAPDWLNGQLQISDIWLDQGSRDLASARQRARHIRYEMIRGLPAWVNHVEHQPGGKGIVTVTLFGGQDESLYAGFQTNRGVRIAAAETTLRTWWQEHDNKYGHILERKDAEHPPFTSSGIQLRLQCNELLEGFRPGRVVRLCLGEWPRIKLPPEERIKDLNDR